MATALNQALLPQWARFDSRYAASAYDIGLWAGPQTKNGPYDLNLKSGWSTASKTVTGPDAQNNQDLIVVQYNGIGAGADPAGTDTWWFLVANVATVLPNFLIQVLTDAGYTLA